ncbi:MAG TPA: 4-hydroxybutyrate--acetyl-CoA CoA transferase [Bacteroidales bacterium]|jgi:acyl-CoA hydrolase|nr:4-hydroxybutyrate--acetyl-CoA CoA transferase [Bacteroidales bacterium]
MSVNLFKEQYKAKLTTPEEAVSCVQSGFNIGGSLGLNDPPALGAALCKRYRELENVRIIQSLGMIPQPWMHDPEMKGHLFNHSTFFGRYNREGAEIGLSDYAPEHMSTSGKISSKNNHINVYWTTVSPMDKRGFMSIGGGSVHDKFFLKAADIAMVEVNENLPRYMGDAMLHISDVDYIVENTAPLFQLPVVEISEKDRVIGRYVSELVEDGATIQLGIGSIPNAVCAELFHKKDLGVHTEMIHDGMVDLYEAGVITNRKKTYFPGRMTAVFFLGTNKLYDFIHDNPAIYIQDATVNADEVTIGQNYKQVSINTTLMVDLSGQVCSESLGTVQYSGTGGALDYSRGARRSEGGKAIMALYSTVKNDTISTITAMLPQGSYVTVPRTDVQYIVTEYGIANLQGRTRSERARALINIAHPDFRNEIEQEARRLKILF